MNWLRFLELACCPICQSALRLDGANLVCQENALHIYQKLATTEIPLFAPQSEAEKAQNKYEDVEQRLAEGYAGLWAFGYSTLHRGETEGFYRTLNELAFSTSLDRKAENAVLEIGCGVGRTICDYAKFYANSIIVGMDFSPRMLEFAHHIAFSQKPVKIDLDAEGFENVVVAGYGLDNVFLAQANALSLPLKSERFDLVVCPNLIDRVSSPAQMIAEVSRVLRPNGYFVFADPFNWVKNPHEWSGYRNMTSDVSGMALSKMAALLEKHQLMTEVSFDGLRYREILDARGSYTDWNVAVIRAQKKTGIN